MGIVGCGNIAKRFVPEASFVNGIDIAGVYDIDNDTGREFATSNGIANTYSSFDEMLQEVDAIYVATPHLSHYHYSKCAMANEIKENPEAKNDLLIPQYDEIFKEVLARYRADFREEGHHSYEYKFKRYNARHSRENN